MKHIMLSVVLFAWSVSSIVQDNWQFDAGSEYGDLFGPSVWIRGESVELHVSCFRSAHDISRPTSPDTEPVLAPRELRIEAIWIPRSGRPTGQERPTIVGSTLYQRPAVTFTPILIGIDNRPVVSEEWATRFGWYQSVGGDGAARFLRALLPQTDTLTLSVEFTDENRRTDTFDVSGLPELLERMAPRCNALKKLLRPA